MMAAAKHGDPQLGIDIHLCTVPPSPSPVPLPTPHMSVVFDPFDYLPILGATVTVCGMKRATAGTNATVVHIPPGFPFAPKLPEKNDELFMGSSTVVADGDPMSHISHPVLGCQVAGMISPPRLRKKNKGIGLLPTTFNLAIPSSVFVGGPSTISLMGMAFKGAFAALGKFAKSGLFKRMRQKMFAGLKPGFLKCTILRAEPVNILTGEVSVEHQDFVLPGRIPIEWKRIYSSGNDRRGLAGYGWETLADGRLEVDPADGTVTMHYPAVGPLFFARLPVGESTEAAELELMDGALLADYGHEYQVHTKEDRIYHFSKLPSRVRDEGTREYSVSRIADLCGNWLEFERRGAGAIGINESAGRRIEIWVENDRIREVALCAEESNTRHVFVRYEYDKVGDLVSVVDSLGKPYTFAYDAHHMVRHTDRNGLSFDYDYEQQTEGEWRVVHTRGDGDLYNYRFAYLDALNERRITDSLGHVTIVKLDERGLPISEIDPLGGMTIFEYDDAGRTVGVTDQDGHRTGYDYDERGNLLKLTRPDGKTIQTEFDTGNKAVTIADANGSQWQQKWDSRGLLVDQTTPLGNVARYEYDGRGQLVAFTNARGARTELAFDTVGNLASLKDALDHRTLFAYDVLCNVTGKVDPLGRETLYRYDEKGRLTDVRLPSGAAIRCAYDAEDNLTRYVDENGAETKFEYFGLGEIANRIQADGHIVQYHYDTEERLIGVTNQRGEGYQFLRDPLGRITIEIDYWGQARNYAYTPGGRLTEAADPLGRRIGYETDPLGRIVKKVLPAPAAPETFAYDGNGNLIGCTNEAIAIERTFDAEERMLKERQGDACTITNTFDANGNRTSRTITATVLTEPHTHTAHYRYDPLDQAVAIEVEGHAPLALMRDAVGQIREARLAPGLQRNCNYGPDGYLTAQQVASAQGPLFVQHYSYDAAGNLTERRDSVLGADRYTYDPLGRLIAHLDPQGRLNRYLSDPAGDRLRTRVVQGDEANWRREGEYAGTDYRFDRAGNLVERSAPKAHTHFRWDANQRLVESNTEGKVTIYRYDPLGRRVSKETARVVTHFFWDGDALAGDARVRAAEDTPPRLREWFYYPQTFEPLAMRERNGATTAALYLYHNDPNGCPTRLLSPSGEVMWVARYTAWGAIVEFVKRHVDNPIRLQGQYEDGETGLYYNRHRYYDAGLGSYISPDPLSLLAGEALYSYLQNAFAWIDPLGLAGDLAQPGEDLFVGTHSQSKYWNEKTGLNKTHTPHHVVQNAVSGVPHGQGLTINLRRDLHAQTRSFSRAAPNFPGGWRSHLAADIMDLRKILTRAGYSRDIVNRQLQELIRLNKMIRGCGR